MALTLSVLRCPDAVPPETRHVSGGDFSIGRAADNDWTLPDPDRTLSRKHCVVAFRSGGWQLADVSANGTYLNREADPVGQGGPRDLNDGDRLRLGAYEIEIRIAEEAWSGARQPAGDPFGDDPFEARPAERGFGHDAQDGGGFGRPGVSLGPEFDSPIPEPDERAFRASTQSDHAPALEQAFRVTPQASLDDWDLDLSKPAQAPAGGAGKAADPLSDWDIDLPQAAPMSPEPRVAAAPPDEPPPVVPIAPPSAAASGEDPFAEPDRDAEPPRGAAPVAPVAAAPAQAAAAGSDLLAAFLRGAGMEDARPADPVATMERLGAAFRAVVAGLRQTLIARAAIKGEFRIEQTMIRARGNNPLKFSAGDDDALSALLGVGRRVDTMPAAAVAEALDDIRLHELAVMAAMQTAVRAVVERFDPAPLRAEGEKSGGLLAAQRRARAFELFEKLHAETSAALADDFDSVFGRAFARAYEQALREVSDRGRG